MSIRTFLLATSSSARLLETFLRLVSLHFSSKTTPSLLNILLDTAFPILRSLDHTRHILDIIHQHHALHRPSIDFDAPFLLIRLCIVDGQSSQATADDIISSIPTTALEGLSLAAEEAPAMPTRPCPYLHLHMTRGTTTNCCYAGLPPELRLKIIEAIVESCTEQHRFIQLHFKPRDRNVLMAGTRNPLPLSICYQSRLEAMRHYVRLDRHEKPEGNPFLVPAYIYPENDTIYFGPVQDFGQRKRGNWGLFLRSIAVNSDSPSLHGSGTTELALYASIVMVFCQTSCDQTTKSLAIRPGLADDNGRGLRYHRSNLFHKGWCSPWLSIAKFACLQRLIIFDEDHSSAGVYVSPAPNDPNRRRLDQSLRDEARGILRPGFPEDGILVVDSRCMPGPGEHFELTEQNFADKRLRSSGNEWGLTTPDISDVDYYQYF